jgi:hypothetical protein
MIFLPAFAAPRGRGLGSQHSVGKNLCLTYQFLLRSWVQLGWPIRFFSHRQLKRHLKFFSSFFRVSCLLQNCGYKLDELIKEGPIIGLSHLYFAFFYTGYYKEERGQNVLSKLFVKIYGWEKVEK